MSSSSRPPRLAEAILSVMLPSDGARDAVLGDLHELYLDRIDGGRWEGSSRHPLDGHPSLPRTGRPPGGVRAALWYWRQAIALSLRYLPARLGLARSPRRAVGPRGGGRVGDAAKAEPLLWQLRLAARALLRSPGFTLPALVILAAGLTSATTMFAMVDSIALRPLEYPDADRLVLLCEVHPTLTEGFCGASPGNTVDLTSDATSFTAAGWGRGWQLSVQEGDRAQGVRGGLATGGFFQALGVEPELGRLFTPDEVGPGADDVVLLSHAYWTAHYGEDPSVVGGVVRVDGQATTIVGVLPAGFEAPLSMFEGIEMWKPPQFDPQDPEIRGWRGWRALARLGPGVDRRSAEVELEGRYRALARVHDEIDDEWSLRVTPLREAVLGDARFVLYALLAAAGLLMLVVCANVANLVLARGLGRRQELAVRTALGASRRRLVSGILVESALLSLVAGVLAVLLASGAVRVLLALAPPDIPRLDSVVFDARALGFALVVSLVATAVFGIAPALGVTADDLAQTVKSGMGRSASRSTARMRDSLIVAELAVSVILVTSAGLLARSLAGYLSWEPGFERDGLVAFSLFVPPDKYLTSADLVPLLRDIEAGARGVPGVTAASTASAGPLFGGGDGVTPVSPEGWTDSRALPTAEWFDIGPGYFETLGLPMRRGHEFLESDAQGSRSVIVVNETLARVAWPGEDPVGRSLTLPDRGGETFEVTGVVADVPSLIPGEATPAEMYWSNRQRGRWGTFVLLRTQGDPISVGAQVTDALAEVDPDLSLGTPRTLSSLEARALVRPRFQASVLGAFALIALLLAIGGVYAVVAFAVERRAREVGIRIALGAGGGEVVAMILRASLAPALVGIALGVTGALLVGSTLRSVVHGVSPTDPASIATAALVLVVASVLAAMVPAARAARVDPLAVIESE